MPYLFRNIIPNIWNIPHGKKGVKAWALFCFLDIRFIWESVVMSNSSKEHLNTDNKVLQQQYQQCQPCWSLNLVLQVKRESTIFLSFQKYLSTNSCFFPTRLIHFFIFQNNFWPLQKKKNTKRQKFNSILRYLNQVLLCQVQCILFHCPRT